MDRRPAWLHPLGEIKLYIMKIDNTRLKRILAKIDDYINSQAIDPVNLVYDALEEIDNKTTCNCSLRKFKSKLIDSLAPLVNFIEEDQISTYESKCILGFYYDLLNEYDNSLSNYNLAISLNGDSHFAIQNRANLNNRSGKRKATRF